MLCFYVNSNDAHTILMPPPFVAILLFQDIIIATIELCEGGGIVIRGGVRLPPRQAAPRLRSHRRRYCDANAVDANAVDAKAVVATPSMQRRQCNADDTIAAMTPSSSTRPWHNAAAIVAATTPSLSALGTPAP